MVEPLKKLQKVVKELGLPKIKFAILEENLTDESGVMKLASLPSRDVLIAQFVGTLNSPIQGLVVTLNGTIQKFVMTLNAIAQNKPASPVAEAAVAEAAPAETPATEEPAPKAPETTEAPTEEANPSEENNETDEKSEGGEN
jgi:large subunit ribosomal protein L10